MIMITDEQPPSAEGMMPGIAAPESLGGTTTILECYVEDADRAVQRALDAGAKPLMPVCDGFYGNRFGWVVDPFGHVWSLGTVKEELTPEEVHERMTAPIQAVVVARSRGSRISTLEIRAGHGGGAHVDDRARGQRRITVVVRRDPAVALAVDDVRRSSLTSHSFDTKVTEPEVAP